MYNNQNNVKWADDDYIYSALKPMYHIFTYIVKHK